MDLIPQFRPIFFYPQLLIMSNSSGSSSESDIEMHTRLLPQKKNTIKLPPSPKEHLHQEPKKVPVKEMVHAALKELNTRKGVALHAIKKYMVEKFNADTLKINLYIKKYIKSGVEAGTIVQTKGIGASGSFRLAPVKKSESKPKKKKLAKPDAPKNEKTEKSKKTDSENVKLKKKASKNTEDEGKMIKTAKTKAVVNKMKEKATEDKDKEQKKPKIKPTKESKKDNVIKDSKEVGKAKSKGKVMNSQTPAKKAPMVRKKIEK